MLSWIVTIVVAYVLLAYVILPLAWTTYDHQQALAGAPMVTRTAQGIAGDPFNIGLVGAQAEIVQAMHAAGWYPADPVTLRTSIEIVGSVLLDRPYRDAPVSALFYEGARETLAFEQLVGDSAHRRHHVRLWRVLDEGQEGRPVWLGAATFDSSVGLSRYTGQLTHHIEPDIDAERQHVNDTLTRAGLVETTYLVTGVGPTLFRRNGEGDRYYTDGDIRMLVLAPPGQPREAPPQHLDIPALVDVKNLVWHGIAGTSGNLDEP